VDDQGVEITKQQFIEPFEIPNFAGFSVATFLPGQTMLPPHDHESLHEIFYVLSGSGVFQIEDVDHEIDPGSYLQIAPKERHGIWVPKSSSEPLKMVVIGIAVGDKK
jgi:quercetin dioxygenase-like cupin family protein